MKTLLMAAVVCTLGILVEREALALNLSGTSGADNVVIGCTLHGQTAKIRMCFNGYYFNIDADCTLSESLEFDGLGGVDSIVIVTDNPTSVTCQGTTQNWWPFLSGPGVRIDLYGGDGSDYLEAFWAGSLGVYTYLHGGNHDDTLVGTQGYVRLYGDGGNDHLFGGDHDPPDTDGDNNILQGGSGTDCLEDADGDWVVFDCGGGSDFWDLNGGLLADTVGCEANNYLQDCGPL